MNRSNTGLHSLIQDSTKTRDVLFVQEPWWGEIRNGRHASVKPGAGWRCLLPRSSIPEDARPRVLAFYKTRRDVTVIPRYDLIDDLDAMAVEVRQSGARPTIYVNIYNQREPAPDDNGQPARTTFDRVFLGDNPPRFPPGVPVVISGDFNEHHPWWETMATEPRPQARALATWMREAGFEIANHFDEPTFASHATGRPSVLDLTFMNKTARLLDTVQQWRVDAEATGASDHYALTWSMDATREEVTNETGARFNWKKADEALFKKRVRELLDEEPATFQALADQTRNPTREELEHAAATFMKILVTAAEDAAPQRRESPHAKPWWNEDLDAAKLNIANAKTALQYCAPHECQRRAADVRRAANYFKRLVRRVKSSYFRELLENATTKELWEYKTWTAGKRSYPTPPLERGNGEPPATEHADKCAALRATHFAPPTDLGVEAPDLDAPRPDALPTEHVTRQEVRDALFSGGQDKAPGPSGISRRALRWAWAVASDEYYWLIAACARAGYHPQVWRCTISACLAKPGKPDYSKCKAYRMIQCEEEPGKDLEKVQAKRLAYQGLELGLIAETQFGGVPGRSVDDAALTFAHDVERAAQDGLVTSALTFDISGYFDRVNHARLLQILADSRLPTATVRWVASFLSGRRTSISLDGERDEMADVLSGIPQGSSVSPILASIFSKPLADRLAAAAPRLRRLLAQNQTPTEGRLSMFVDDGLLYASSRSFTTNNQHIAFLYGVTKGWADDFGVELDPIKCDFSHFTLGLRNLNGRAIGHHRPSLTLPRADGGVDTLVPSQCYRWLGIWWDPKFTFAAHVSQMAERASSAVSALSMLGKTTQGLSPLQLRQVHTACTLSILTFGATVWYTGDRQLTRVDKLDVVLRRALRHVLGAFKTTPSEALYVEASMPPMRLRLQERLERGAIRFASFPAEHPIRQRLGGAWSAGADGRYGPLLPPSDSNNRRGQTRLQRMARLYPADGERVNPRLRAPWVDYVNDERWKGRLTITQKTADQDKRRAAIAHAELVKTLRKNDANLIAYTDGSLLADKAGAGAAFFRGRAQLASISLGLGEGGETYDGELFVLARAARSAVILAANTGATHLWFFADNDAAVGRAFERAPHSGQIFSSMFADPIEQFLTTDDGHRVTVAWVPGHEDLEGQEASDSLAKAGTSLAPSLPVSLTITRAKRAVSDRLLASWRMEWLANERRNAYTPANRIAPSTRPTPHLRTLDKSLYARVFQCRTPTFSCAALVRTCATLVRRVYPLVRNPCATRAQGAQSVRKVLHSCARYFHSCARSVHSCARRFHSCVRHFHSCARDFHSSVWFVTLCTRRKTLTIMLGRF